MNIKKTIHCKECGKFICYEEDLMHMVIPCGGFKCPHCGAIVVTDNDIIYGVKKTLWA